MVGRPKGSKNTKENIDLQNLKDVINNLNERIQDKKTQLSNLEAEIHRRDTQTQAQNKVDEVRTQRDLNIQRQKLIQMESNIVVKEEEFKMRDQNINDRLKNLEAQEQIFKDLNTKMAELNKKRGEFLHYKATIETELEKAKVIIAEAKEMDNKLATERESLRNEEIRLKEKQKYIMDQMGELEEKKKKFGIELSNFEAKKEEVVNV